MVPGLSRPLPLSAGCRCIIVSDHTDHVVVVNAGNTGCGNTGAGNVGDYNAGSGNQGYCNQGSGLIGTGLSGGDAPGCRLTCPGGSNLAGQPAPGTPCAAGQTFQLTPGGCAYGLAQCCKCVGPTPAATTTVTPAPAPSIRKLAPAPAPGPGASASEYHQPRTSAAVSVAHDSRPLAFELGQSTCTFCACQYHA